MKKILFIVIVLVLFSCNKGSFKDLKEGMTSKEVIELVGKPKQKQPLFNIEYWVYGEYFLTLKNDTLTNVFTKEEMKKGFEKFGKGLDSLNKSLNKLK